MPKISSGGGGTLGPDVFWSLKVCYPEKCLFLSAREVMISQEPKCGVILTLYSTYSSKIAVTFEQKVQFRSPSGFRIYNKYRFHSEILASINFKQNKILSPGLENNHTLKSHCHKFNLWGTPWNKILITL